MAHRDIIAFIASILAAATPSAIVLSYQPDLTKPEQIPATFGGSQAVQVWYITPAGRDAVQEDRRATGETLIKYQFKIVLLVEVGAAVTSHPLVIDLGEAARVAFRPTHAKGPPENIEEMGPLSQPAFDHVMVGQTFGCWYAEFLLSAQELTPTAYLPA